VAEYNVPSYNQVNFTLEEYLVPSYNQVDFELSGEAPSGNLLKYYNGSAFVATTSVKVRGSSSWVTPVNVKVYNSGEWKTISF
jgi:hypothetical protein